MACELAQISIIKNSVVSRRSTLEPFERRAMWRREDLNKLTINDVQLPSRPQLDLERRLASS